MPKILLVPRSLGEVGGNDKQQIATSLTAPRNDNIRSPSISGTLTVAGATV